MKHEKFGEGKKGRESRKWVKKGKEETYGKTPYGKKGFSRKLRTSKNRKKRLY